MTFFRVFLSVAACSLVCALPDLPAPTEALKSTVRALWANGTLQRLAHGRAVEPLHAHAQSALRLGSSLRASEGSAPPEEVAELVFRELGLRNSRVLKALHGFGRSCSGVAIVQQASVQQPYVYNSATIQCQSGSAAIWWQGVAETSTRRTNATGAEEYLERIKVAAEVVGETQDHQAAMDVYLLLTALSVGHAIQVIPSKVRGGSTPSLRPWQPSTRASIHFRV